VLEAIELNAREIRMEIAKKIKNQVKKVPELRFYEDETQEYAEKIDKLLQSIKKD
jgi:ribosome-binding factor A